MNNKELAELNAWAADKVNAKPIHNRLWEEDWTGVIRCHFHEWTLTDARCRNVFWEWFFCSNKGYTKRTWHEIDSYIVSVQRYGDVTTSKNGTGKTIEEAELACINAIMLSEE